MMPRTSGLLAFAVIALCPVSAFGQLPALPPPRTVPDLPGASNPGDAPFGSSAYRPGSAGPYGVTATSPEPLLIPEPIRLKRPGTEVGWYAAFDLGLVKPHITNRVTSGAPLAPAFLAPVEVPIASLDWNVSPRFQLGYHLPGGVGDLRFGYRLLATSGSEDNGVEGTLRSRLEVDSFDFDYVSSEWLIGNPPELLRDLRLVGGIRLASVYFDSGGQRGGLSQRFTSHFVGFGPRFGVEWYKPIFGSSFQAYCKLETTGLLGRTRQDFAIGYQDGTGGAIGAARTGNPQSNGMTVLETEAGFAWRPWADGRVRVVGGYHFEQWWDFGRTNDADAQLTVNGLFLRGEWRY